MKRTRVTVRKVSLVVFALVLVITLTGCGDSVEEIRQLEEQIEGLTLQNSSLQSQLNNMQITEVAMETSLRVVEGSNIPTFETIDGLIKFPNKLELPNSSNDVNNSNMVVGSRFKFTPSSNWLVRMEGASMHATHPSSIWGTIKAITVKNSLSESEMKPLLQGFFEGFPSTTITYRKAFMDDRVVGLLAKAPITVDGKEYVVNVGSLTRGDYGLLILFVYEDNGMGVQQELIDLLIGSCSVGEAKLKLE